MVTGQYDAARVVAERAVALADECSATRSGLQARITLATVVARQDDFGTAVRQLRECLVEAVAADAFKAVVRCFGNLAFIHWTAGHFAEALEVGVEAERTCRRFGPLLLVAPTLTENWIGALVATGRWDEAEQLAGTLQQQWATEGMALTFHLQLAHVAAARGDQEGFVREVAFVERFARPDDPYAVHDMTSARAEHLLWRGEQEQAHRLVRRALDQLIGQQDAGLVLSLCSLALRAHADVVTAGAVRVIPEVATRETAHLLDTARETARHDPGALGEALLLLCEAEAARATSAPSVTEWTRVVAQWEALGCRYPAAYGQWRLAEALFGARARAQGARVLVAALHTAVELGSTPLEQAVRLLARHAGVPAAELDAEPVPDGDAGEPVVLTANHLPVHLTPRERDVLRILTDGFSNQQIARRLFISESTVSVHVSHIIAKLGVSNRLQAASAAQRLNLFPSEQHRV